MYPVLCRLGPFSIYSYGFMIAIAFIAGILVSLRCARHEGIEESSVMDLSLYVIIAAIVGARLLYVIGQWNVYRNDPLEILMVQKGGLVFLGGLILAILTVITYSMIKRIDIYKLLDALTPGTALGYSLGRIGCFLNGCCFGLPTKLPWGIIFPPASLAGSTFPGEPLHPTQLYSTALIFLVFLFLLWLYRSKRFDGQIFFWGLVLYSIERFIIESLRYSPSHWLGLTPMQWMVIFLFIIGIGGLNRSLLKRKS